MPSVNQHIFKDRKAIPHTNREMGHHIFVYTHEAQILNTDKCDSSKPQCPRVDILKDC